MKGTLLIYRNSFSKQCCFTQVASRSIQISVRSSRLLLSRLYSTVVVVVTVVSLSALAVATLVWEAGERKPTRLLVATLVWEPRAGGKGGDPPFFSWRPGTNKERDSLTDTTPSVEPGLTGATSPYRTSWKTPRRRKTASTHLYSNSSTSTCNTTSSRLVTDQWH